MHVKDFLVVADESDTKEYSFGEAIELVKQGNLMQSTLWNGKGMFIFQVDGSEFQINRPPLSKHFPEGTDCTYRAHIDMKDVTGAIGPWLASQIDVQATYRKVRVIAPGSETLSVGFDPIQPSVKH